MTHILNNINRIKSEIGAKVTLVVVSKTQSIESILEAYKGGQRIFGENKVQELVEKYEKLPKDIEWHMIGHLQTNKVKYIAPFVHLIHGIDSLKLLKEVNKQAAKVDRVVNCLLQLKVAQEETKFGMSLVDAEHILKNNAVYPNTQIVGIMGMATNSEDEALVRAEFKNLKTYQTQLTSQYSSLDTQNSVPNPQLSKLNTLSMGMSSDYTIAIEQGSTMVRIGSSIFNRIEN